MSRPESSPEARYARAMAIAQAYRASVAGGRAEPREELLQRHEGLRELLDAMLDCTEPMQTDVPASGPIADEPERIGPYRILDLLGEGGMGRVYLAEQRSPVQRRVALKLIKLGMDTRQVLARFEAERQALAMMEHDNIAKVFDAGTTDTGQPYFVMEYVAGMPLVDYCDRENLTTRARLELFSQICAGVQHAHQKGVIHRDLKPSNILVSEHQGRPVPKIIDFGVAKATNHRLVAGTLFTEQGQTIGTPEYMSPEQTDLSSANIDTRTDIYSLGVILYELLVGGLPFCRTELQVAAITELQRRIREEEPVRPSARISTLGEEAARVARRRGTSAAALTRRLRGDLDWIVMKALEKDRNRRYSTPVGMAEDISRHLDNQPVNAGPPSVLYRTRKFVRRYRLQVGAAAVVSVAVVAGSVGVALFALRAETSAAQATVERNRAEELTEYMLFDLRDRLEPLGQLALLDSVARRALDYYEASPENPTREARRRRGVALNNLGVVFEQQGDLQTALTSFRMSLEISNELVAEEPDNATWQHGVAVSWDRTGKVLQEQGALDEALAAYGNARHVSESLARQQPENPVFRRDLAVLLGQLGELQMVRGEREGGLATLRESLDERRQLAAANPDSIQARSDLWSGLWGLGHARFQQGELDAALHDFREALPIVETLTARDPANTQWQRDLATSQESIGKVLLQQGELDGALDMMRPAAAAREALVARDTTNAYWQRDLGLDHAYLGAILEAGGDLTGARDHLETALAMFRSLVDQDASNDTWRLDLIRAGQDLGRVQRALGNPQAARAGLEEGLELAGELVRSDPDNAESQRALATGHERLGDVLAQLGESDRALSAYRSALVARERVVELRRGDLGSQRELALAHKRLGTHLRGRGELSEARQSYSDSRTIHLALVEADPENTLWRRDLVVAELNLGNILQTLGEGDAALELLRTSVAGARALVGADPDNTDWQADLARSQEFLAEALLARGEPDDALQSLEASLQARASLARSAPDNAGWQQDLLWSHNRIGDAVIRRGDVEAALEAFGAAREIAERLTASNPGHPDYQRDLAVSSGNFGAALLVRGDTAAAVAHLEAAVGISERLVALDPDNFGWRADLATGRERLAQAQLDHGDGEAAVSSLRAAVQIRRDLLGRRPTDPALADSLAWAESLLAEARSRVGAPSGTSVDLATAYAGYEAGDYGSSAAAFERALGDEGLRGDLRGGHLYNAACSAALAGPTWREKALLWLRQDVELRLQRLADVEGAERTTLLAHFAWARSGDPDLASLRDSEEFENLFAKIPGR